MTNGKPSCCIKCLAALVRTSLTSAKSARRYASSTTLMAATLPLAPRRTLWRLHTNKRTTLSASHRCLAGQAEVQACLLGACAHPSRHNGIKIQTQHDCYHTATTASDALLAATAPVMLAHATEAVVADMAASTLSLWLKPLMTGKSNWRAHTYLCKWP